MTDAPAHLRCMTHTKGGYRYLTGHRFCSNGVAAEPGHALDHVTFSRPVELGAAFDLVQSRLARAGRPVEALCGFDLQIPGSLSLDDFRAFNAEYLDRLEALGLLVGRDLASPLARTNVAPTSNPPAGGVVAGFTLTLPIDEPGDWFVISGVADVPDGATYPENITRRGEASDEALLEKLRQVVADVLGRVEALGSTWDAATAVHLYSPHPLAGPLVSEVLAAHGIVPGTGARWHDVSPPAHELELEIDARRIRSEHLHTSD